MVEELNLGITFPVVTAQIVADAILDIKDKKDYWYSKCAHVQKAENILVAEKLPEIFSGKSCFKLQMKSQENWNFTKVTKLIFCQLISTGTCLFVILFYSPSSETLLRKYGASFYLFLTLRS